jgi:CBS domain-containing protein
MIVANILHGKPRRLISLGPSDTLQKAAELLARERIGAVLVMDGERMVGILSERDIIRALSANGAEAMGRNLSLVMTKDVHCASPGDSVDQVMAVMTEKRFRHLPVREGDKVVAMISIGDVVKSKVEEAEAESETLREYIARG